MKQAMFWESRKGQRVKCQLCQHRCLIRDGERGICGVRENREGTLYTLVYGKSISQAVDPIEKKPLYHFLPGSQTFSIATLGCNFHCLHCQNFHISQVPGEEFLILGEDLPPERIVALAKKHKCQSISYTYTEPTIFFEYAYDTARLAASAGIRNVFVTNGYITPEALREIHPYLDAANIDLKFFRHDTYRQVCGAKLAPVLGSIRLYRELGIWIELTTLIIPSYNDSDEELLEIATFIAELGKEIPWHITQFHPTHELLDKPATPVSVLEKAYEIGLRAGLKYIYPGNVPGMAGEDTRCSSCETSIIKRSGVLVLANNLKNGNCPGCGNTIAGVWG